MLIALLVLIYIAWTLLKTYRNMETQLREIKQKCISPSAIEKMSVGTPTSSDSNQVKNVTNTMINGLQKMMLAVSG